MGKKAIKARRLINNNDVFADIVNLAFALKLGAGNFTRVKPEDLEDAKVWSDYEGPDGMREQYRDVAKFWKAAGVIICLLGIENQTGIDPDMPLRVFGYEGGEYHWQLTQEGMELFPVLTIVLYFGTKRRWRKNKTLFERLNVPEELRPLLNDCRLNVIELAWLTEEEAALCTSDIKIVIDYLRQVRLNKDYVPSAELLEHVHPKFLKYITISMCNFL